MSEVSYASISNRAPSTGSPAPVPISAAGSELRMSDMEYGAAAHPHQMCIDTEISAQAYRVWGVMDFLKRNRIAPKVEIIADLLAVTERSVERWITELSNAHWLVWNKNAADPWHRYVPRQSNSDEEVVLAKIRALFTAGEATVEAIARIVQNDRNVESDKFVETGDPTITRFDRGVETGDPTITRFDNPVTSDSQMQQQEAPNADSPAHVGVGASLTLPKPTTAALRARIAAHTRANLTVAEIWLRAEGVSKKKAAQFRDFDVAAIEHEWQATVPPRESLPEPERQKRIGGLLDRWEVRPPAIPPPRPPSAQHYITDEAPEYAQARALLPNANPLELHYLYLLLEDGADPQEALRRVLASDRVAITLALTQLTHGGAP